MSSDLEPQPVVAVSQFSPHTDKAANLDALSRAVCAAADQGADLMLAPEYAMFAVSRLDHRVVDAAEPLDGPFVTALRTLAQRRGLHLVAGLAERLPDDPERVANTVVAVEPSGDIAAVYRKIHLYDAFGFTESDVVRPGDVAQVPLFDVKDVSVGIHTCYDLRFPESARRLATAGAQVLLTPAQWIPGPLKEDHWTTLLRARAIENTLYVAAASHSAPRGAGNSMIVDPMVVVLTHLGDQAEAVATAAVDRVRLAAVRAQNPCLSQAT